jgi:long-chain-fatty-acid---luciferin-component ligase
MSDATSSAVMKDIDRLDVLLSSSDVSTLPPQEAAAFRLDHIRTAVAWHIERNERYARFCAGRGFDAGQLNEVADLSRIPLLPASLFKRGADTVATEPADDSVFHTTSSGTQGTVSVVPRDDRTMNRFFATLGIGTYEVLGQERSELRLFNLGPLDAGHLWIAYVMSGVALFTGGECYVQDDRFLLGKLVEDLAAAAGSPVMVVGPPPLLMDAAAEVKTAGITLHPDSLVATIGGWKKAGGRSLPRAEFVEVILDAFGLPDDTGVRDTFNMVELNTVMFECAHHRLHVPPWLYADAKDPRTLEPVGSGENGVLGFLDATPTSYPGFVLSDDFGSVDRDLSCECGRTGDVLRLDRRINRLEGRGCALKLDQRTNR